MLEKLILENEKLIYSITKYFRNYHSKEDLFQVGCIGLIKAYRNYDNSQNVKFTTYAYPYVLGEMRKLVREDKGLKINRDISKLNLKIEKAYVLLTQKLEKEPSVNELAEYLMIPVEIVADAIKSNCIQSLDEVIFNSDNDLTVYDMIADQMNDLDSLLALKEQLENLSEEERELINLRYMNDLTQSETSKVLGMSQVQVSRKEQKVLVKMRERIMS